MNARFLIKNKDLIKNKLKTRNFDVSQIDDVYNLAVEKNQLEASIVDLQAQRNQATAEISLAIRNGENVEEKKAQVVQINKKLEDIKSKFVVLEEQLNHQLLAIPNLPQDDVPIGKDENDNVVIKTWGTPKPIFEGKAHYDFGIEKDYLDFHRAVKISGQRFVIYKTLVAKLVRALMNLMLDTHTSRGYQEILTNTLVHGQSLYGTGQLPKFEEDLYKIEGRDLWLVPTAEVPITNYYQDEIIDLAKPQSFVGYSKSYRSEAGSAGKDTRGIIRMHEFHKVELVKFTNQKDGIQEFEKTVEDASYILELLEIPYRQIVLCTGDMGFSSQKTIDLEAWMPSENKYREVSSVSFCGDFQAQRAKIRYRDENQKIQFACTINGSGLAIDRIVAILLEQYQQNGEFIIPKALKPYFN